MNFDLKNGFCDGFGMVQHHFDLVGVVGPDAEEFAGGEGEPDPALALVAPEVVLRLAAEDRQRLGGGDLHALAAEGGEEIVVDALQSQIQIGMDAQVIPGGIVLG